MLATALPAAAPAVAKPRRRRAVAGAKGAKMSRSPLVGLTFNLGTPKRFEAFDASVSTDRLYDLLMTQNADGSFPFSSVLVDWLGAAHGEAKKAMNTHGEAVAATALVIALLERGEVARGDEWGPAARKARAWLKRQKSTFDARAVLDQTALASKDQ